MTEAQDWHWWNFALLAASAYFVYLTFKPVVHSLARRAMVAVVPAGGGVLGGTGERLAWLPEWIRADIEEGWRAAVAVLLFSLRCLIAGTIFAAVLLPLALAVFLLWWKLFAA